MSNYNPPCAKWNIWLGREIEGKTDIGKMTLFIRRLPPGVTTRGGFSRLLTEIKNKVGFDRVWYCKEFDRFELLPVTTAFVPLKSVALEVLPSDMRLLPPFVRQYYTLYVKLPLELKPGDHVCVGMPYRDEAFKIGKGKTVKPDDYQADFKYRPLRRKYDQ